MSISSNDAHAELKVALKNLAELQMPGKPDIVVELISDFIAQSQQALSTFESALEKEDCQSISQVMHMMKSGCLMLGASELGIFCEKLEKAALKKDLSHLADCYQPWKSKLHVVQAELLILCQERKAS